jgi:mannose/fructose/N-acetylgalactosamine-specific phosphotransferase system component IID
MKPMEEFLNSLVNFFKPILLIILTGITSLCAPIGDVLAVLFYAFLFNIFAGIASDANVNAKQFSLKKAFEAIKQALFYFFLIWFIHYSAENLGYDGNGHLAIKWVTITVVYFYLTNILRNASAIFPNNKAIAFMYVVLTTQIFNKLRNYFGFQEKQKDYERD